MVSRAVSVTHHAAGRRKISTGEVASRLECMGAYVRPSLIGETFLDENGAIIPYGNRWGDDSPPEDSYSRESNLQRFKQLHDVAGALIDHLVDVYEVETTEDPAHLVDLLGDCQDAVRVTRLNPRKSEAAALTFVFTSYPGVIVHAGLLHDFRYPACGCDACDETAESLADDMEWHVLAVVAGNYTEEIQTGIGGRVRQTISAVDGSGWESSETRAPRISKARRRHAKKRLKSLPAGWQAWPRSTEWGWANECCGTSLNA